MLNIKIVSVGFVVRLASHVHVHVRADSTIKCVLCPPPRLSDKHNNVIIILHCVAVARWHLWLLTSSECPEDQASPNE